MIIVFFSFRIRHFFDTSWNSIVLPNVSLPSLKRFSSSGVSSLNQHLFRSSPPDMFLGKGVLKICCKFTGQQPYKATLLKSHFGMGVLLSICCIISEHLFLKTPLEGCFWSCQHSPEMYLGSCRSCFKEHLSKKIFFEKTYLGNYFPICSHNKNGTFTETGKAKLLLRVLKYFLKSAD